MEFTMKYPQNEHSKEDNKKKNQNMIKSYAKSSLSSFKAIVQTFGININIYNDF